MNRDEYHELADSIDYYITVDRYGDHIFDRSKNFEHALQDYAAIRVKYAEDLEYLIDNVKLQINIAKFLNFESLENQEDLAEAIKNATIEYYRDACSEFIEERCEYLYVQTRIDAGLIEHIDRENGEVRWIGGCR